MSRTHVLIAGGGVAALETLLALRDRAAGRVHIGLLAPERDFTYRPLAVGEAFGHTRALRYDLSSLARRNGADHIPDALASVDPAAHLARTRRGEKRSYDVLVVATGARMRDAVPGALTFRDSLDTPHLTRLLRQLEDGAVNDLVFAVPVGAGWPLPVYELALMTANRLGRRRRPGVRLTLVTPEEAPLAVFGAAASDAVRELLDEAGVELVTGTSASAVSDADLEIVPGSAIRADRVVSIPRPEGRRSAGLPCDAHGFLCTDGHGAVGGVPDVYAAGDGTSFPVKQGGLAAQQADAVADAIAARAGADLEPRPFRPVLRGALLTGRERTFLASDLSGMAGDDSQAARQPLWWPPGKIAGRHLTAELAELSALPPLDGPPYGALPVEVTFGSRVRVA